MTLIGGDASAVYGNNGDTDGGIGTSTFYYPAGIAVDSAGNYFVAEYENDRVRKVTSDGTTTTIAGGTSGSTVLPGYVDGVGASARFTDPYGIAVDGAGLIYVADSFKIVQFMKMWIFLQKCTKNKEQ